MKYKIIAKTETTKTETDAKTIKTQYIANSFQEAMEVFLREKKHLKFNHIYIARMRVEK